MSQQEVSPPISQVVTRSEASHSHSSRRSRTSQAAAQARADAEAAYVRARYAKRQIDMEVEKARIEATLHALKTEGEAEAALAAAKVWEATFEEEERAKVDLSEQGVFSKTPPSIRRAQEYVHAHFDDQRVQADGTQTPNNEHLVRHNDSQQPQNSPKSAGAFPHVRHIDIADEEHLQSHRARTDISHQPTPSATPQSELSNLAAYLARRDLLTSGFKVFDNRPESYLSWKSMFCNATEGLNLKPSEELDLLTKWLGGESLQHAQRIRAVHVSNPQAGLQRLWQRLDKTYGSPEVIESSLFQRLQTFPRISNKDTHLLQELADLLLELSYAKSESYLPGLSFLDTPRGINPIVEKLPYGLQESWVTQGTKYKRENGAVYPPFSYFVRFVNDYAEMRTDPSFMLQCSNVINPRVDKTSVRRDKYRVPLAVNKIEISPAKLTALDPDKQCPIHQKPHSLVKCRGFRMKTLDERKNILKEHAICFKCCASTNHRARDCKAIIQCSECDSDAHVSAMHVGPPPWTPQDFNPPTQSHGGESEGPNPVNTASCTEVCGQGVKGKSCSKICLVNVYRRTSPEKKKRVYAMLDDQSNSSLARSAFFDMFNVQGTIFPYTMRTCAGLSETRGRKADGFIVEDVDGKVSMMLPTITECDQIPDNRDEIPSPEVAAAHPHLRSIASQIPPLDPSADILLLLGRDIIQAHKVRGQVNGPNNAPHAQRLDLGWVVIGDVCLSGAHKPTLNSFKTNVLNSGRPTFLSPCENTIVIKEKYTKNDPLNTQAELGQHIFQQTTNDDKVALSAEDALFLDIMHNNFAKDEANNWVAPLPFRSPRRRLPDNRQQAYNRLMSLRKTLRRKPEMRAHYAEFMEKIFSKGHAEPAPALAPDQECWYLPSFGVYHPQKPEKIRVVFDSSAQLDNVSLNDVLLKGPDLNNTLVGVLMRFRSDPYAVMADVEHMFHNFVVREDHRNYLRFLWFQNHDLDGKVQEFRMTVHVFGNCPSPSVAIFGLKRTAIEGEMEFGSDAKEFIERHFYVDDGLKSFSSIEQAIDVLSRAQKMLAQCNIRLHKISSNCPLITGAFPTEDRAVGMQGLDIGQTTPPMQRSLGLGWELLTDQFKFQVRVNERPFTKRGVLSVINSVFDPLGFAIPVIVGGRTILRDISTNVSEWDTELPKDKLEQWQKWKSSLGHLQHLEIPRMYTSIPLSAAQRIEIDVFCDASTKGVGAVAYLKLTNEDGHSEVGFLLGKARLAPKPDITIPRLELCAAVLAVEVAELVLEELDVTVDQVNLYTDSKVVLGYISNMKRRFHVYVHNRVERIRRFAQTHQWHYVPTHLNPADHATRTLPAEQLSSSTWLRGPAFLSRLDQSQVRSQTFDLIDPETDCELRPEVTTCTTTLSKAQFNSARFERFSSWKVLQKAIAKLQHIAQSFKNNSEVSCRGWHNCNKHLTEKSLQLAKTTIIRTVQREVFAEDIGCIEKGTALKNSSPLSKLNPFVDTQGLLKVGGRLKKAQLSAEETNPILVPGKHHLAQLIIRHFHEKLCHQGRHFTEGAVRAGGFWIVGGKRAVSSVIFKCITCRKLRGRQPEQIMAELPEDRLSTDPPFTNVGLDVFGPWSVTVRKTRGANADAKRWAVIFTCMSTRAIHIEVIESMDTSSFINALRRFFAIRGGAKLLRSDCGTNFVSACKELQIDKLGCHNDKIGTFLKDSACKWQFNPPHASHMAGSWERMIGVTRKILNAMLLEHPYGKLTHEVLVTLLAEVTAIVNARPLTAVSTDPENPVILTPAMLLTQQVGTPPIPPGQFQTSDLFKAQWKRVQYLANVFWSRWQKEYIAGLQVRRKWKIKKPNLQMGDVVLMRESLEHRNNWPLGLITKSFPSEDGNVRKVEVKICRNGENRFYIRPIREVVLLLSKGSM
ncbi:uncharacterized protein LOC130921225 [Corythoichthys intestinalis]|uniref:uncharacterized protein LOC130921225 n=1 Tax=Corythoichthys intestinalis TaxID=161448 RepID=UPI0025A5F9AB|nr:uncharacterized protein LOC130921225 [Corythoichthys intestinalis]